MPKEIISHKPCSNNNNNNNESRVNNSKFEPGDENLFQIQYKLETAEINHQPFKSLQYLS